MPIGARNISVAELTRQWDQNSDSGIYFDQVKSASTRHGLPRVWVPRFREVFGDHFFGAAPNVGTGAPAFWNQQKTAAAGTPTMAILNQIHGVLSIKLGSTGELEVWGINFKDNLSLDPKLGLVVEFGYTTTATLATNESLWIGVGTAHNDTFGSISRGILINQSASGSVLVDARDNVTNQNGLDPTITLTAGLFRDFRIEFANPNDVRVFQAGARILTSKTLKTGTGLLQPMAILKKASGTTTPELQLDYFYGYQKRS